MDKIIYVAPDGIIFTDREEYLNYLESIRNEQP